MTYHGAHAPDCPSPLDRVRRFLSAVRDRLPRRTPCGHGGAGGPRWTDRHGSARCPWCGHRTPYWLVISGQPFLAAPPRTRELPCRRWFRELPGRHRARRARVSEVVTAPGPAADSHPRRPWVLDVDEPPTGPQLAGLARLEAVAREQAASFEARPDADGYMPRAQSRPAPTGALVLDTDRFPWPTPYRGDVS